MLCDMGRVFDGFGYRTSATKTFKYEVMRGWQEDADWLNGSIQLGCSQLLPVIEVNGALLELNVLAATQVSK